MKSTLSLLILLGIPVSSTFLFLNWTYCFLFFLIISFTLTPNFQFTIWRENRAAFGDICQLQGSCFLTDSCSYHSYALKHRWHCPVIQLTDTRSKTEPKTPSDSDNRAPPQSILQCLIFPQCSHEKEGKYPHTPRATASRLEDGHTLLPWQASLPAATSRALRTHNFLVSNLEHVCSQPAGCLSWHIHKPKVKSSHLETFEKNFLNYD